MTTKNEQISFVEMPKKDNTEQNKMRRWKRAFQKWSDKRADEDATTDGKCGYGVICDYCFGSDKKNPCIKAFTDFCKKTGKKPDYDNLSFEDAFYGDF